jgi:hypothetical protein
LTRALTCFSMFNALSKCTPRFLTKGASLTTQPSNCNWQFLFYGSSLICMEDRNVLLSDLLNRTAWSWNMVYLRGRCLDQRCTIFFCIIELIPQYNYTEEIMVRIEEINIIIRKK